MGWQLINKNPAFAHSQSPRSTSWTRPRVSMSSEGFKDDYSLMCKNSNIAIYE